MKKNKIFKTAIVNVSRNKSNHYNVKIFVNKHIFGWLGS